MKDSNMAIPLLVPGLAHSVSPTVLSTCREAKVLAQSTGCEQKWTRSLQKGQTSTEIRKLSRHYHKTQTSEQNINGNTAVKTSLLSAAATTRQFKMAAVHVSSINNVQGREDTSR